VSPKKAADPRSEQLLLRLTKAEMEVLESIAHLERVTPNAYAYALLSAHIARLRTQPHVAADLTTRRSYAAQRAETAALPDPTASNVAPRPADTAGVDAAARETS
jgi:hypothetical protein